MQYKFGFASAATGSQDVWGTNTRFLDYVSVGDIFKFRAEDAWYEIGNVVSQTHLILTTPYAGTNKIEQEYAITRDFTTYRGYPEVHQGDLDAHWILTRALRLIDKDIASGGLAGSGNRIWLEGYNVAGATISIGKVVKFLDYYGTSVGITPASAADLS